MALVLLFASAAASKRLFNKQPDIEATALSIVQDWYGQALEAERYTEGYRGPVAARMYGYVGLAAYESAFPFLKDGYQSQSALFPELVLPKVHEDSEYYLPAILNSCYSKIFENFFATAPDKTKQELRELFEKWAADCKNKTDAPSYERSARFGEAVAMAVFEWSATDSLGHQAYLHLFDRNYKLAEGDGKWLPCPDFPLPALLPYWGQIRLFTIRPEEFLAKPHTEYSDSPNSEFYKQALEIYTLNTPLSNENLWIAEFWGDDQPGLTFSPCGRWISITKQVVDMEQPPLGKALETYLKMGYVLNDAMVSVWQSKYLYNLLRPETYITKVFDPEWHPVHHTPPFPAYPSGHAMMGAAAAEVLTEIYGDNFRFVDRSHARRTEFKGMPRSFGSFYEMAFESAFSRIPLGVHYRMDCEEGIRLGLLVGKKVGKLKLKNEKDFTLQ